MRILGSAPTAQQIEAADVDTAAAIASYNDTATKLNNLVGQLPASLGQKAKAASLSIVIATDQGALAIADTPETLTYYTDAIARLTSLGTQLPATLGQKVKTASLAVTWASDQGPLAITDNAGSLTVDAPVATPLFARISDGTNPIDLTALLGALTETAPATDTASAGTNGRLQRVAQNITSLIGRLPGSLGQKAMAASLAVTVASDQAAIPVSAAVAAPAFFRLSTGSAAVDLPALLGPLTETAPATDTASAGTNGRLQRVAQNITSLISLLPGSLGQKTMAASLAVTLASNQTAVPVVNSSVLTTSTQTLSATGLSATVSGTDKASIGLQLLWTGASTDQVVRLEATMDGTTWVSLSDELPGTVFTQADIAARATAGVQPGLRYGSVSTRPEYASYRVRWVSGTATSLQLTWGLS